MSEIDKIDQTAAYAQDNAELRAELDAVKKANGAKRVELSRKLFGRFCEFQGDLSDLGNFCEQLGLSRELSEFVFSGLRSWAEGGSVESALWVESKPGRPPKTERNQILFEDVRSRVQLGWDVHAACYAAADALGRGEVEGLPKQELSPSSIRRVYYAVMNESEAQEDQTFSSTDTPDESASDVRLIDSEILRQAKNGEWEQSLVLFQHMKRIGDVVLTNRYVNMVGSVAGLDMEGLAYWLSCLQEVIDGQAPNEAFRYKAPNE